MSQRQQWTCETVRKAVRAKTQEEMTPAERGGIIGHIQNCIECKTLCYQERLGSCDTNMNEADFVAMCERDDRDPEYRSAAGLPPLTESYPPFDTPTELPGNGDSFLSHIGDVTPAIVARPEDIAMGQQIFVLMRCGYMDTSSGLVPTVILIGQSLARTGQLAVSYACPECGCREYLCMSADVKKEFDARQEKATPGYTEFVTKNAARCMKSEGGMANAFLNSLGINPEEYRREAKRKRDERKKKK